MPDILVRTGNGKTDLMYVSSAAKNLKVLQKTGTKSVQWITTAAGQSYNNILVKNGTRNLAYQSISIPSDIPSWFVNEQSGTLVNYSQSNTMVVIRSYKGLFSQNAQYGTAYGILQGNESNNFVGSSGFAAAIADNLISSWFKNVPVVITFIRLGAWATTAPALTFFPNIRKMYIRDVNNPSRKFVALLERDLSQQVNDTLNWVKNSTQTGGLYSYAPIGYQIRDYYSTIDNFRDGNTYRTGLRLSDT